MVFCPSEGEVSSPWTQRQWNNTEITRAWTNNHPAGLTRQIPVFDAPVTTSAHCSTVHYSCVPCMACTKQQWGLLKGFSVMAFFLLLFHMSHIRRRQEYPVNEFLLLSFGSDPSLVTMDLFPAYPIYVIPVWSVSFSWCLLVCNHTMLFRYLDIGLRITSDSKLKRCLIPNML